MSTQTTAAWQPAAQPFALLQMLKEIFAATPLGLVLAAIKSPR